MEFFPIAVANGDIYPCRFVKIDPTVNNRVIQCTGSDVPIGISQKGTHYPPIPGLDDGKAAVAGEGLQIFAPNQTAPLLLGGTVAAGDYLKPDSNGEGVTATTGNIYGAIAPMAGVAGTVMDVKVALGTR